MTPEVTRRLIIVCLLQRETERQREMLASLVLLASLLQGGSAYFADWSQLARDKQPTCVDIPVNMTLCHNIGETLRHFHPENLVLSIVHTKDRNIFQSFSIQHRILI